MVHKKGEFDRKVFKFRNTISSTDFPAEVGRYAIYFNYGCPWAHRANLTRCLKGLENVVQLIEVDAYEPSVGWFFSGKHAADKDPITGLKTLRELYKAKDAMALENAIASVPVLFDTKTETIVNNESSEIIRILYSAFDEYLPDPMQEAHKGSAALLPGDLEGEINTMNEWVYETVNNGVYRCGYNTSDDAYAENVPKLYAALERLEQHLSLPAHQPYLFGENVTEADIRLYPTIVRFDYGYSRWLTRNGETAKQIRLDYPNLHDWVRRLYWDETPKTNFGAFRKTTKFDRMAGQVEKLPGMGIGLVSVSDGILPL